MFSTSHPKFLTGKLRKDQVSFGTPIFLKWHLIGAELVINQISPLNLAGLYLFRAAGHYEDRLTGPNQILRPNKVLRTGPNQVLRPKKDLKTGPNQV